MAESPDYDVLVLSSIRDARRADRHCEPAFQDPTVIYWEMGNMATKPGVYRADRGDAVQRHHFLLQRHHPQAPPSRAGAFRCTQYSSRSTGARWRVRHLVPAGHPPRCANTSRRDGARDGSGYRSRADLRGEALGRRRRRDDPVRGSTVRPRSAWRCATHGRATGRSPDGTRCFQQIDDTWHPTNRHHTVADVRQWFEALDPAHPAHQERVPFNHPRAIISPPYFDDV